MYSISKHLGQPLRPAVLVEGQDDHLLTTLKNQALQEASDEPSNDVIRIIWAFAENQQY